MTKWGGSKDRYDLPNDPGPFTVLWWHIEDLWRGVNREDKMLLGLVAWGVVLYILWTR